MPDAHVGAVLSDLSGRRGRVTGTEPDPVAVAGMERTVVHAEVPEAELIRYAITLRSLTAGTGRFSRAFAATRSSRPRSADPAGRARLISRAIGSARDSSRTGRVASRCIGQACAPRGPLTSSP